MPSKDFFRISTPQEKGEDRKRKWQRLTSLSRIWFIIGGSAFFFFFLFYYSLAGQPLPSSDNRECLRCHGLEASLPPTLKIDESAFASSAHASLSCTDCHLIKEKKASPLPHEKNIPTPDCTASCHRQDIKVEKGLGPLQYKDSVHGRAYLERGEKEVAKCWDCHGKHNIKGAAAPDSTINRLNIPRTCSNCHENMAVVIKYHIHREAPYQEYRQSVHGRALFDKGMVSFAAVCTDCHGVHNIQGVSEPHLMARQPATCGRCHEQVYLTYKESIHGQLMIKGDPNAPLCVDCHGEHSIMPPGEASSSAYYQNIPRTCAACHARPDIMKKYGVPADRIATFIESLHGIALEYGVKGVATCVSCHGAHNILPAIDPRSAVNPVNLAQTCNQSGCHRGMPESVARTKIHIGPAATKPGVFSYVERILIIMVILTVAVTIIWFIPGLIRRTRLLTRKRR